MGESVASLAGGRGGIRTPDTLSGTSVFKTDAINHSATLPLFPKYHQRRGPGTGARCSRMPHTSPVLKLVQYAVVLALAASGAAQPSALQSAWQAAAERAARTAPEARIVVLDVSSGQLLASHRLKDAARTLAAPGSTLKPLLLYELIAKNQWDPNRRVVCDRRLAIAGHRLQCTHPLSFPFDAREALAWSCNTYFANLALSLAPGEIARILRPTGVLGSTGLVSPEATAEFHAPLSPQATQLALLGVEGIRITPLELAAAYRWLAAELAAHSNSKAAQVISAGLMDSASTGMARQASRGGAPIAGKTGTAEGVESSQTHGWFAGLVPADHPKAIVVVYLPAGRGADAALLAGELAAHSPLGRP